MHDTGELLAKLTALRQQLEQAQGLARDAGTSAATLLAGPESTDLWRLERQIPAGGQQLHLLDGVLRGLTRRTAPEASRSRRAGKDPSLPRKAAPSGPVIRP